MESLEDRCLLSGNVAPMLSGRAFIDAAHTGRFHKGDPVLPGVTVTLTGTTYLDTHISATTKTNAHGVFEFLMVPNGTYRLSFHDAGFLVGSAGIAGHHRRGFVRNAANRRPTPRVVTARRAEARLSRSRRDADPAGPRGHPVRFQ